MEQRWARSWGTFKYLMTLQGGGLLKPSDCRHMERGGWPNRHITFIVAKKLDLQFILLYLRYMWGGGGDWLKTSYGGLAENVRIPSYGGRGLKLLKNPSYDILIFERSLDLQNKIRYFV